MKKLIITMALLVVSAVTATNAQYTVTTTNDERTITHIGGDNYEVVYTDAEGNILKEGHYLKVGEEIKPHGVWKLYDRNTFALVTTAKYDKGEQIWVETNIDGQIVKVDQIELKVKRLEARIATLEKKINDIQE